MRRELGSSVRLPGSAFRKRKDGTTYVNMRHLSEPIRWEDIEGWLDTDGAADTDFQMAGAGAAVSEALVHYELSADSSGESEEEIMKQRLELVKKKAHKMQPDQLEILVLLIRGETYDDIQRRKNIKRAMLLNIIEDATEILYSKD